MTRITSVTVTAFLAALAVAGPAAPAMSATDIRSIDCGWPDRVQNAVIDHARRLMPPSLQRQLVRHRRSLADGARRAHRHHAAHLQPPLAAGGTAGALAESLARVAALLDAQESMREVVREMGVTAHLIADLSNPFRNAPADPDTALYAKRFGAYLGERRDKFRVVFEGYTHPLLDDGEVTAFGMALADRSRSYLDDLIGGFRRYDSGEDVNAMDDRSIPFGVASLTYSRSVTDTARAWLHAWRRAHGDVTGLPYPLEAPPE